MYWLSFLYDAQPVSQVEDSNSRALCKTKQVTMVWQYCLRNWRQFRQEWTDYTYRAADNLGGILQSSGSPADWKTARQLLVDSHDHDQVSGLIIQSDVVETITYHFANCVSFDRICSQKIWAFLSYLYICGPFEQVYLYFFRSRCKHSYYC